MADKTSIEWTGATWNPITGCSIKSPGCNHCYAMNLAATRLQHHPSRAGLTKQTKAGPVWTGEVRFNEQWLGQPLRWKEPRDIFVVAHGDLFHENVPDEWIDRVFAVMAMAPRHRFQVLTKRPDRMNAYFETRVDGDPWAEAADYVADLAGLKEHPFVLEPKDIPLSNIWLGTSVERQQEAYERCESLHDLAAAGWNTWVSYEPALGPVDWTGWEFIRWFVGGGESGPKARPSHPDWHRASRDFCVSRRIPYFFKQWGNWAPCQQDGGHTESDVERLISGAWMLRVGKKSAGYLLDGVEWRQTPGARP